MFALSQLIESDAQNRTIEGVVKEFSKTKCSDFRDRIYAFFSLIDWSRYGGRPLEPDYSHSTFRLVVRLAAFLPIHEICKVPGPLGVTHENIELRESVSLRQREAIFSTLGKQTGWRSLWD